MTDKDIALERLSEVFEFALTNNGFNHPFSRDLQIWMTRLWGAAGTKKVTEIRRAVTAATKETAKNAGGTVTQVEALGLKVFRRPRSMAAFQATTKPTGEQTGEVQPVQAAQGGKLRKAKIKPVEREVEQPDQPAQTEPQAVNPPAPPPNPLAGKPAAAGKVPEPLSDDDLLTVTAMSPKAILGQFGEGRIEAALVGFGEEREELESMSGAQKAALLKSKIKARK